LTLYIKCVDEEDENENKKIKRDLFNILERKLVNIESKFIIIRNRKIMKKYNMKGGE